MSFGTDLPDKPGLLGNPAVVHDDWRYVPERPARPLHSCPTCHRSLFVNHRADQPCWMCLEAVGLCAQWDDDLRDRCTREADTPTHELGGPPKRCPNHAVPERSAACPHPGTTGP